MSDDPSPANPPSGPAIRGRALRILLIGSLTLNVLGAGFLVMRVARKGGLRYVLEQFDLREVKTPAMPFQVDWRARLRKLPNTEGEIVFLGDSLVANGPWAELFSPIKNRGIGGETTANVLDRLDEIVEGRPAKVFILLGTNCLASDTPIAQVARNYRKILDRIRRESPQTRVYSIGVLPVNQKVPGGPVHDNRAIQDLNRQLRELAKEFENVRFIDATRALTDERGDLRRDLTDDGLHLNIDAYLILGKLLEPYVVEDEAPGSKGTVQAAPSGERNATFSASRTTP
jgi:lysophospholipase L1-like esterase